ncbi:N-acetylmuramoyl-L-alanine amidase [Arenimonas maotaiensis]|uniref:N-acetylmuramoyl-L-alanine amidase AmiC n=1 Tax=Arenimonas maotaiensis TaxID=1446479 RepID=A0A917FJF4_9GAMM|nr:N-acetylmuramoyl-L-alanine amidase [Arenimonas maotaiensis]GGF83449.1 N-acetylmuramoyl-L-alanine amidase [Arenimonas maotaiensis]
MLKRLLCLALLLAAGHASAAGVTLSGIVLLQDGDSTKALIDLSGPASYKSFTLKAPDRAVLDIDGAQLAPQFALPPANGIVLSVRQGKTPTGVRLVFDLVQGAELATRLDDAAGKPRLALELRGKGAVLAAAPAKTEPAPAVIQAPVPAKTAPSVASTPAKPAAGAPASANVPGRSNIGYALMDDEIVQIDIDSSGDKPTTTVKPAGNKPVPPLPSQKPSIHPTPAQAQAALPKKAKTVNDVLGPSARKLVIAIDAGHGGKDPGALGGSGLREKDVTLRVAKELAALVNADPGMRAVLIRDDDTFVPLQERYQRARRAQADLFVSIHADAALNNAASGSSVFVLSTKGASSQAARWLADKENAADLVGGVSLDDKDKNLSAVLLDLSQSATMRMSEDAAEKVLGSLKDLGKAHKKQVEHANFVVLRSPDVPSMLVETGFITNPDEERKLGDPEHRKRLAYAIAQGLRNYFVEQPLPGTYYARKGEVSGAGVTAAGPGIIP